MADSQLNSNNNSQLLQTLWMADKSTPYEYRIIGNFCNGSRIINKVTPVNGSSISTPSGVEVVFQVPRTSYYLQYIFIRSKITTDAAQSTLTSSDETGLRLFQRTQLRAHGFAIWTSDPYNNQVRNELDNFEKSQVHSVLSQWSTFIDQSPTTVPTAGASSFYVSSPVYCPLFDKTYMYYDTVFQEPLELGCIVDTNTNLGLSGNGITAIAPIAYCFYRAVDNESYVLNKGLNFKEGEPTTILLSTTFTESALSVTTQVTNTTFDIKCKNVAQSTSFFMVANATTVPYKKIYATTAAGIDAFTFTFAGQQIFSTVPTDVLLMDRGARFNSANINCSNLGALVGMTPWKGPHTIYWSEDSDRTFNSHALAYYNGGQPQLTAYHTQPNLPWQLIVVHDVFELFTIDTASGQGQVAYMT